MNHKAILFDLDGTLLDTIEDLGNSMNSVLERFGFPKHEINTYKYFVGDGVENLVMRSLPTGHKNPDLILQIIFEYREEYGKRWAEKTRPYPGIPELLTELNLRRLKISVLSNKPDEITKIVIAKFFPHHSFEFIVGAKQGIPHKPDPESALEISRMMRINPSEFLYLGDTDTDMKTANSAGMFAIGVLWGFRSIGELLQNGAKLVISNPLEILKILDNNNDRPRT